jgi:HPt (histidine-containing phosphotransfer) domain-containing protein
MPLFFWILIGVAGVMLAALIVVLLAEIRNERHRRVARRKIPPEEKPAAKKAPKAKAKPAREAAVVEEVTTAEAPEAAAVPTPSVAEEVPPAVEEAMPSEPSELAVEVPVPEAPEVPEVEAAEAPEAALPEEGVEVPEVPQPAVEAEAPAEAAFEPTPYPEFSNARAVEELGLSQEEADMFMGELVSQIEEALPDLEAAAAAHDTEKLEAVSHMLKGSATNLGTGGVADALVDFNTYCKEGNDPQVIQKHMDDLHFYFDVLKSRYGA